MPSADVDAAATSSRVLAIEHQLARGAADASGPRNCDELDQRAGREALPRVGEDEDVTRARRDARVERHAACRRPALR